MEPYKVFTSNVLEDVVIFKLRKNLGRSQIKGKLKENLFTVKERQRFLNLRRCNVTINENIKLATKVNEKND